MTKLIKIFIIFDFLIVTSFCLSASAETYFVDNNTGSNLNDGLSKFSALKTIQHCAEIMRPGDKAIVVQGTYDERISITKSGSQENPVTFQAEDYAECKGFTIEADYIYIIGFEIQNVTDDNRWNYTSRFNSSGIHIEGNNNHIINNRITGATCIGINLYGNSRYSTTPSNCMIKGNSIKHSGLSGIYVVGDSNTIQDNNISHIKRYAGDADGIRFFGKKHIFRQNQIHDILMDEGNKGAHIDCFQTYEHASDILFEKNTIENPNPGHQGIIIQENSGLVGNMIFRNNIFIMAANSAYSPAFTIGTSGGKIKNIKIYNNTFIRPSSQGGYAIRLKNCSEIRIKNNIFVNYGNDKYSYILINDITSNIDISNNAVYTNGISPLGGPFSQDLWMQDPKFVNIKEYDFRLSSNSPLIDVGIGLTEVQDDMEGTTRPQGRGYDLGAYEFLTNRHTN